MKQMNFTFQSKNIDTIVLYSIRSHIYSWIITDTMDPRFHRIKIIIWNKSVNNEGSKHCLWFLRFNPIFVTHRYSQFLIWVMSLQKFIIPSSNRFSSSNGCLNQVSLINPRCCTGFYMYSLSDLGSDVRRTSVGGDESAPLFFLLRFLHKQGRQQGFQFLLLFINSSDFLCIWNGDMMTSGLIGLGLIGLVNMIKCMGIPSWWVNYITSRERTTK